MPEGSLDSPRRRFVTEHAVDAQLTLRASVAWNGETWTVTIDDALLPDCCSTIEEAFSVAEKEIARRFPHHACLGCKEWQHPAEESLPETSND